MKWEIEEVTLPLKFNWKLSRNETETKNNFVIKLKVGDFTACSEVAFNVHFGESRDRILEEFSEFKKDFPSDIDSVEGVMEYCSSRDFSKSLRFGVESAFVHYMALATEKTVPELLGVPFMSSVETSFSLPILKPGSIAQFLEEHDLHRFKSLKIKVEKNTASETLKELMNRYAGQVKIDANESWEKASEVLSFIDSIDQVERIEFLEQPIKASEHTEMLKLKEKSSLLLMADESITSQDVTQYYQDRFHGVNIKLMKSGSYMRALLQLRQAKELGLKTMLGCMVETSLGISSAMNISYGLDYLDLDGHLLLQKDPFGLVIEEKGRLFRNDLH